MTVRSIQNSDYVSNTRPGLHGVAADIVSAVASLWPDWEGRRSKRRNKVRGSPPPLPDWLRADVGLPPVHKTSNYWDHQ